MSWAKMPANNNRHKFGPMRWLKLVNFYLTLAISIFNGNCYSDGSQIGLENQIHHIALKQLFEQGVTRLMITPVLRKDA